MILMLLLKRFVKNWEVRIEINIELCSIIYFVRNLVKNLFINNYLLLVKTNKAIQFE